MNQQNAKSATALYISVNQASEEYGLGQSALWEAIRDGRLKAYRPAGIRRTFLSRYDMAAFMSGQSAVPKNKKSRGIRPSKTEYAELLNDDRKKISQLPS